MFAHSHGDAMYWTAGLALVVLAVAYAAIWAVGKKFKQNIPLAVNLFIASGISALAVGFDPFRHLFEGPVWYIYINLVIFTGMIFLTGMRAAGNLDCIAYDILTHFRNWPSIILVMVMLLLFFPGMVTGVGTAAILSTGMVSAVNLAGMRHSKRQHRGHLGGRDDHRLGGSASEPPCDHHRQRHQHALRGLR